MNQETKGTAKQAFIYARVSSKEQAQEGYSIPAQLKYLREYAKTNNITVVTEFVDVETAKRTGRTHFNVMVKQLKQQMRIKDETRRCRAILVEKTDRLYRNLKDWVTLDELDIEIHFAKENCVLSQDSRSSEKLIHGIKVLMAKNYIDNLSEESHKGLAEKASQGIFPAKAPLGYLNVECDKKKIIQVDDATAPFVRLLFEWYATGNYSLKALTQRANEEILPEINRKGKFGKSTIYHFLTNPFFYGDFVWRGDYYSGTHEPIIDRQLFEKVQDTLYIMGNKSPRRRKFEWAFQGMVTCGHCGCMLTAEIKKGKYIYYHCTGHKGKCPERYVREEELSNQFAQVLKQLEMPRQLMDVVVKALKESHGDEKKYHAESIAKLRGQHDKLQDRLDLMYVDKLDGKIGGDEYSRLSSEWRSQLDKLAIRIAKHDKANISYYDEGINLLELSQRALKLYDKQSMAERRKLLKFVFSNSVWKDGELSPEFRKPFNHLASAVVAYQDASAAKGGNLPVLGKTLRRLDSNQ